MILSDLKQLGLLLWKNYSLQKRSLIGLFLEIVLPMLFAIVLLPIRGIVKSQVYPNDTLYSPFQVNRLPFVLVPPSPAKSWYIGYTPIDNALINETMTKVVEKITKKNLFNFTAIGFSSENDMISTRVLDNGTQALFGGVTFLPNSLDSKELSYKIRLSYSPRTLKNGNTNFWKTNLLYPSIPTLGPRSKSSNDGGDPGYFREGFLTLQNFIDTTYINLVGNLNNDNLSDIISLQRFPFPPYNDDNFVFVISAIFPFILMISFVFTVILTAKAIVYEKETGIKEAMKLMGMKPWIYWLSWYIKTFILLIPAISFIIISFKIKLTLKSGGKAAIINETDPLILIIFFFLYASSSILFIFLMTTFFKKSNSAAAGAGVLWFLTYLPFIFIQQRYEEMSVSEKLAAAFLSNVGMSESIQLIGNFESKGVGIQWSNINQGVSVTDRLTFLQCLLISLATSFIHLILFVYFEQVLPGDHGIAKKWYFPLQCLKRKCSVENIESHKTQANGKENKNEFVEAESTYKSRKIGIKIDNVTKAFKQLGKTKIAVDNLSLNILENQITVLLGHNGAGKSTTISMITGLASPNSGQILVNSYDVVKQTQKARKQIGYCPQYNLLFDDLTVAEHLRFFAKLKENYDSKEIDTILDSLNLSDKKNSLSKTLSGGMKRKLSVAIAFIGGSKIVILDEPTSGMDPQARHATWTVLQQFKKERQCSILLTTHFMDEADFLGDRIAIMSRGELRCCGSPMFLKSKFGSGYNLVLTKRTNTMVDDAPIANLIKKHVYNAQLNSNISSEISFVLPKEDASKFPSLFIDLETHKDDLKIVNIGISVTTVEEVFLKIGDDELVSNEDMEQGARTKVDTSNKDEYGLWAGTNRDERNDSFFSKYFQQFYALINKKFIHSLRNKILVISQLIIPIGTLLLILILVKYGPITANDSASLGINMDKYRQNYAPIKINNIQNNPLFANMSDYYLGQFGSIKNSISFSLDDNSTSRNCTSARSTIDEYVSCIGKQDLSLYTDNYVIGATFVNETSLIGHFNNQPYHTSPLTLNFLTNAMLKSTMKSNDYHLNVVNEPLPRTLEDQFNDLTRLLNVGGFQIASTVTFGFSFLIASFITFLIRERVSNAKHMQYLNGAHPFVFWLSTLTWDFVNYLVPAIVSIILILAFDVKNFTGSNIQYIIGLFVIYGLAHIPQTYLISYIFKKPSTGFATNVAWNILASQITIVAVYFLQLPALGLADQGDALEWIFLILLPNFAFGQSLTDLYTNYENVQFCTKKQAIIPGFNTSYFELCNTTILPTNPCCGTQCTASGSSTCLKWTREYMDWNKPGLGRYFLFMPLQFITQFGVVLLYELGYLRRFKYAILGAFRKDTKHLNRDIEENDDMPKDVDVIEEEKRVAKLNPYKDTDDLLVTDSLTKYYSNFMAVKGISLGIKKGECFGLLGVNGAGKTTTFKMITGDETITKGDVYLNNLSIKSNINIYQKQMGYCPQFDPLIEQMTVEETLVMYARLRGLKESIIKHTCKSLISILDLNDHSKKMCYTLSGGNKRKLSVAISLIGSPKIVLLDEPTSGMDPKTRRYLWNCLENIREKGKSLILTSHSMEETEALCTRMCIMVNGELKCLGNLQHLKSKYGDGYTLLVKIIDENARVKEFIEFILKNLKNAVLKENRDGFINIQIKDNSTKCLAQIFLLVEKNQKLFSIEYYLVTQTKLEQIFLNFAARQIDPSTRFLDGKVKKKFFCC